MRTIYCPYCGEGQQTDKTEPFTIEMKGQKCGNEATAAFSAEQITLYIDPDKLPDD